MPLNCSYHLNLKEKPGFLLDRKFNRVFKNEDPLAYHSKLRRYESTPLILLPRLAKSMGIKELYIKDESRRFRQNTFKTLGASFAIHKYLDANPGKHIFCTATDGNHGRSVAWAAKMNKQKAVIFVPADTAISRIKNIKKQRGKVIVVDGDYDAAVVRARDEAEGNGYVLMQDMSWEDYTEIPTFITTGYKTMMMELEELIHAPREPLIDFVFLQCGVGTWASSVVAYYRNRYPKNMPMIVAVEPLNSDSLLESIRQERVSKTKGSQQTLMSGLNCGTPSPLAWKILKDGVDLFLAIPDDYAIKAMQNLYFPFRSDTQIFAGESGAAGLGGLTALAYEESLEEVKKKIGLNRQSRVLIFNTEGVTDPDNFEELIIRETEV
ncbi:MAG: diaminopropionate ammonia-lyase [Bacteroidales bacterium]